MWCRDGPSGSQKHTDMRSCLFSQAPGDRWPLRVVASVTTLKCAHHRHDTHEMVGAGTNLAEIGHAWPISGDLEKTLSMSRRVWSIPGSIWSRLAGAVQIGQFRPNP